MNNEELTEMSKENDIDITDLKALAIDLDEWGIEHDILEIAKEMFINESPDFVVGKYRYIDQDKIDDIMIEKLADDAYGMGCFTAAFLADLTDLPTEMIEVLQLHEEFEMIGDYILQENLVPKMMEQYSSWDGYGPCFASYDGEELEICNYYAFKVD